MCVVACLSPSPPSILEISAEPLAITPTVTTKSGLYPPPQSLPRESQALLCKGLNSSFECPWALGWHWGTDLWRGWAHLTSLVCILCGLSKSLLASVLVSMPVTATQGWHSVLDKRVLTKQQVAVSWCFWCGEQTSKNKQEDSRTGHKAVNRRTIWLQR